MLLGAIALTIVGALWLFTKPASAPDGPAPTAVIRTTTPTPISTRAPTPTPQPVAQGAIGIGVRVSVNGTGDVGLSIRSDASVDAERVTVAAEGEQLLVVGGPKQADEYTWWFVRDEVDPDREGWAVEDFLRPSE